MIESHITKFARITVTSFLILNENERDDPVTQTTQRWLFVFVFVFQWLFDKVVQKYIHAADYRMDVLYFKIRVMT